MDEVMYKKLLDEIEEFGKKNANKVIEKIRIKAIEFFDPELSSNEDFFLSEENEEVLSDMYEAFSDGFDSEWQGRFDY